MKILDVILIRPFAIGLYHDTLKSDPCNEFCWYKSRYQLYDARNTRKGNVAKVVVFESNAPLRTGDTFRKHFDKKLEFIILESLKNDKTKTIWLLVFCFIRRYEKINSHGS